MNTSLTMALGEFSLYGTLFLGVVSVLALIWVVMMPQARGGAVQLTRACLLGMGALLTIAAVALLTALLKDDFSFAYVVSHSELAMPWGYKLAAFWAGQEGSLLLWAWLVAVMGMLVAFRQRTRDDAESAWTATIIAVVVGFFAALMLLAKANPFALVAGPRPPDGHGMNPLLQHIAMIAHPPTLFVGYAGFTIPFAMMIAAMVTGRRDGAWLPSARVWTIMSWLFLGVGIILGAWWAYLELGWGGYWAWDPVENASLLPWLTGTALIHSIVVQQKRGIFKRWTVSLIALTFLLCFFGTYLTRSGIIQSVHAFPKSRLADFLLAFLVLTFVISCTVIALRWTRLKGDHPMEEFTSREGVTFVGNVMLVLMMAVTMVGTLFPLLAKPFSPEPVSVPTAFYNNTILPMGLILAITMALGPVLTFGNGAMGRAGNAIALMAAVALGAAGVVTLFAGLSFWSMGVAAVTAAVVTGMLIDLVTTVQLRQKHMPQPFALAALNVIYGDRRRWGGHLAHLGMAAVIVGICGSSVFSTKSTFEIPMGDTEKVGQYAVKYVAWDQVKRANYDAVVGTLLITDPNGTQLTLKPEQRFYPKSRGQNFTEVALNMGLRRDIYAILAGWDDSGRIATLQVYINPMVNWIWIGGILMTLGGIYCVLPHLSRKPAASAVPVPKAPEPAARGQGTLVTTS